MGDLYSRVYHLPRRLQTVRSRIDRLERVAREARGDRAATLFSRIAQTRAREAALVAEAARFGFTDLVAPNLIAQTGIFCEGLHA